MTNLMAALQGEMDAAVAEGQLVLPVPEVPLVREVLLAPLVLLVPEDLRE